MRDLFTYWTTDNGAPYTRIEYQLNKAGHALLIGFALLVLAKVLGFHLDPVLTMVLVVTVYWSADLWAPFADHAHTADHPFLHWMAKLVAGLLAPALLIAQTRPIVLVWWFVAFLVVLLFRL